MRLGPGGRGALLLLVTLVVASCGGSSTEGAGVTTSSLRTPDGIELTVIESRLVALVPSGFSVMPDDVRDTGPSDLAKAVRDQGGTDEDRQFLVDQQFNVGYQRFWADEDDGELIVFLYHFESADGASAQSREIESGIRAGSSASVVRSFVPTGLPGSIGLESAGQESPAVAVLFTKGAYWGMVRMSGLEVADLRSQAVAVAREQFDRLP